MAPRASCTTTELNPQPLGLSLLPRLASNPWAQGVRLPQHPRPGTAGSYLHTGRFLYATSYTSTTLRPVPKSPAPQTYYPQTLSTEKFRVERKDGGLQVLKVGGI